MNLDSIALLLGMFCLPVFLMFLGHRLRGRSSTHKRRFWGGVVGYVFGMGVAISAMILPPVWWVDGGALRPFLVHWAMVLGGLLGVITGPFWARSPGHRS